MRTIHSLVFAALPLLAQAQFTVVPFGPSTIEIDTRHGSGNRFEFTVTNNASALDYITIQRASVLSAGQPVFGVPSPEYGVSIPPGESARMWFRWDLIGRISPGTYSAAVPFKSERSGATVTRTITFIVRAPAGDARSPVTGTVRTKDASPLPAVTLTLHDRSTGAEDQNPNLVVSSQGAFNFSLLPGDYTLSVEAPGYQLYTEYFSVPSQPISISLTPLANPVNSAAVTAKTAQVASSIWTMRASADASVAATAPMGSTNPSAFHTFRLGVESWSGPFPGLNPARAGTVSQFQATDCDVTVSADGQRVAGMDYNGRVYFYNFQTGTAVWSTDRAQDRNPLYPGNSPLGQGFFTCGAVAISPDGTRVAAGGSNGTLALFDAASGNLLWTRAYSAEIRALRFTPDGAGLAVGAGDWKFRLLAAATGQPRWEAENHFWPLFFVGMDEGGTLIGSGGKEAEFRLWDAATGALRWRKQFPAGAFVSGAAIFPEADRVFVSDWSFGVRAYDIAGNELWFRRINNAGFAATPDGQFLLTAGYGTTNSRLPAVYLMNANGTVLWEHRPDTANTCKVQAPFASDFLKSMALARTATGLRAVVACVGGGVFHYEIPLATPAPAIAPGGVVNAASFAPNLAPGAIATIFGENLTASVRVGTAPAPVYAATARQLNVLIPPALSPGPTSIVVESPGGNSSPYPVTLSTDAPGIFFDAASGIGAILVAGSGLTTAQRPAVPGEFLEIYCTGLTAAEPQVTIAGRVSPVTYSGQTPVLGLYQVNVQLPVGTPAGVQPVQLTVLSGAVSNSESIRVAGN